MTALIVLCLVTGGLLLGVGALMMHHARRWDDE